MSTILSADDLNDFIAPGVACIKPVEVEKTKETAEIAIGDDGRPLEEGHALAPAQISLQDCLACSGCITSSEAMLVELQSPRELLNQLEKRNNCLVDSSNSTGDEFSVFIASVSHQTRASLAKAYNLPVDVIDAKLRGLFIEKLGFKCVLGTEIGRAVSLEESWREVTEKSNQKQVVLSSICPGWTLYAEKTHPEILDFLSSVRSPQQITGNLAKRLLSKELGVPANRIYHVSIMPCFDKKLESARPEFSLDEGREVDLVVTAKEIIDMLNTQLNTDLPQLPSIANDCSMAPQKWPKDDLMSNGGSSSGGYLDYILNKTLRAHPGSQIACIPGKNSDFVEFQVTRTSETADGTVEIIFRGAQVYGFRNIQNLVRKLKMKRGRARTKIRKTQQPSDPTEFDYVELMACPGGCVNGGGQIGAPANVPAKVWTQEMNDVYNHIAKIEVSAQLVDSYYAQLGITPTKSLLRTEYKPLKKDESLPAALTVGTQW